MDFKNLKSFIVVAETGNFTRAANILGYSQSTVSFQIKQLETELNCKLFDRINHKIELTSKGYEVLKFAYEVTNLESKLCEKIESSTEISGMVSLATADSLGSIIFDNGFKEFRNKFPNISIKVTSGATKDLFRMLNHNEADLVLTLDRHIYSNKYNILKEVSMPVKFVCHKDNPLANKKNISLSEIAKYPFILTEKGVSYRGILEEQLSEANIEISPVLEIGNTDLICSLVLENMGISFLPKYVTEKYIQDKKLAYIDVKDIKVIVWKQLLCRKDKWISPEIKCFIDFCIDKL